MDAEIGASTIHKPSKEVGLCIDRSNKPCGNCQHEFRILVVASDDMNMALRNIAYYFSISKKGHRQLYTPNILCSWKSINLILTTSYPQIQNNYERQMCLDLMVLASELFADWIIELSERKTQESLYKLYTLRQQRLVHYDNWKDMHNEFIITLLDGVPGSFPSGTLIYETWAGGVDE